MKLFSPAFSDGAAIPEKYAFGAHDPQTHVRLVDNLSPPFTFEDVPAGAKSLVLLCVDVDVPSRGDDVNQAGKSVPKSLPRVDFFHWALVDLPPSTKGVAEGQYARGVTARGKSGPDAGGGARHGLNDYTGWFASDADMKGQYFGYDGPCPPWNDALVHRYQFHLYALDVPRLGVDGAFTGPQARAALEGHVLAHATVTGTYAINPAATPR